MSEESKPDKPNPECFGTGGSNVIGCKCKTIFLTNIQRHATGPAWR